MNILYFADADISINKGGVNRITHSLSRKFMSIPGWKCYLAYLNESKVLPVSEFNDKLHISGDKAKEQIKEFINYHQIDKMIVILTVKKNIYFSLPIIYELKSEIKKLQVIFCYHICPGFELFGISPFIGIRHLFQQPDRINTLKLILQHTINKTPFAKLSKAYIKRKYRFIYDRCDHLVLLSSYYISSYAELADIKGNNHIISIPNPLPLSEIFPVEQLNEKRKEVLIVARLAELQKQLTLALQIWQFVEKNPLYHDWKLVILGNGIDEQYYKTLANRLGLKNISFEGRKEPLDYYRRASIFMMTSLYEGWPLTLLEAQQMGVVPIAFDTFGAVREIIQHEQNGILIPAKDIHLYAQSMMQLMSDSYSRKNLAYRAIEHCQQFSMDKIIQKWSYLFKTSF